MLYATITHDHQHYHNAEKGNKESKWKEKGVKR